MVKWFLINLNIQKMDLSEMAQCLAFEPINSGVWSKPLQQKLADEPSPRAYHSCIVHKASLYIYGGIPVKESEDHLTQQRIVYKYNITAKTWSKHITNFLNNISFSYIACHSTIIFNNMMYLFGGKNYKTKQYIVGLWCLNLQSFNWKRQQLKGYSPSPREYASLVLHQRNIIVLYGGRNNGQNLNDFHIYKIENKLWIQIQQYNYDMKISCRLRPALASQGDYLYLFGGQRMVASEQSMKNVLLNDFYQLKFLYRPMSTKPDIWAKQIITNVKPAKRIANFVNISDKYLLLWGGENYFDEKMTSEPGFWLYSIQQVHWNWIKIKGNMDAIPSFGYSINYCIDKCYIFGRRKINSENALKISNLLVLNLDLKEMENKLSQLRYKPKMIEDEELNCHQCFEYRHSLTKYKFSDFIIMKQSLNQKNQFVFSAFGLLLDNSLLVKAKQSKVVFHNNSKEKFCLIQDNGNFQVLWENNSDFINDMMIFKTYIEENIDQLEEIKEEDINKKNFMKEENVTIPIPNPNNPKETKQQRQQKQKQLKEKQEEKELRRRKQEAKRIHRKKIEDRKQFSRNIKLGSLRIGDRVLFINKFGPNNQNRRVFVIQKYQSQKLQEYTYTYRTYYYVLQNNSLTESNMDVAKKYIDQEYKIYFKIANERKQDGPNFVFITNLKEIINDGGQIQSELKQSPKHGDVFCCQKRQIQSLQDVPILECIDVSLKTYLMLLYLKSEQFKVSLVLSDNKPVQVSNPQFFDKIDQLSKSQKIVDLVEALDLSNCKIIEVYYNKCSNNRARDVNNRKPSSNNFLNGVLLYQKNRLISRYKYSLGDAAKIFKNKVKPLQQALMTFGFIQIKDELAVNVFKTAFIRDDLLEQIYNRLKFVEKYAEKVMRDDVHSRSRPPLDDKNNQKNNEGRKKFKPNQQSNASNVINLDQ